MNSNKSKINYYDSDKENVKNNNFTKLTRRGISLIVLVITIIVIIILAAAIIISLNNNNPIMEANTARYESDRANMQAVFTNAVSKVMAKNQATVTVSSGQINTVTGGVAETTGEVSYTLTDAQNESNATGTIVFDKGDNTDTKFYTGKKHPIYAAGDTKWYVDSEGNISLEVAGTKYGNGEVIKPSVTLISGPEFNNIIPKTTKSIEFLNSAAPIDVETIDVSESQDGSVVAWIDGTNFYVAPKNAGEIIYANPDSSCMFDCSRFDGEDYMLEMEINNANFTNLNTSKVVNMEGMFRYLGTSENEGVCTVSGIENFDTANVTNMKNMFYNTFFYTEKEVKLDLSKWDVSNVTNMSGMFSSFSGWTDKVELIGLNNWDVSNVTNMVGMFYHFAYCSNNFSLDLSNWGSKTANVKDTYGMFYNTGSRSETFYLNLSNWDTSSITKMDHMFTNTGMSATTFELVGLENWDISNVKEMTSLFSNMGSSATSFNIDLSNWNTSKVTSMYGVFESIGASATDWSIGDLSTKEVTRNGKTYTAWDVSNVTKMWSMFEEAGKSATIWNVGNIGNWNTSNVTDMREMFYNCGAAISANPKLDISSWDVSKVKDRTNFIGKNTTLIISPW